MKKHQKVAVIVWTIDPEGNKRFLFRHNKPFDGYEDEWTIVFGDVEKGENAEESAVREVSEEFGISDIEQVENLNYKIKFDGKHGLTEIHFFAMKVGDIDVQIILNEESIGYDWMTIEKTKEVVKHEDERQAFDLVK